MGEVVKALAGAAGALLLGATLGTSILVGLSVFFVLTQQRRLRGLSNSRRRATQTVRAAVTSAKWRIGTTRCHGLLTQVAWKGRNLQMTLVIGEAPIVGVSRVWIQGRGVDVSGTSVDISADDALGEGGSGTAVHIDFYLAGGGGGAALAGDFADAEGLLWEAGMTMNGLAFAVISLHQNEDNDWFRSIPEFEFLTTGYGGSADAPISNPATPNAAEVRRWWEVEREDEPVTRIEGSTYTSAVTTCASAGYEVHGTIEADDDPEQTRAALDFAMDGTVIEWGGELRFLPGTRRSPTLTIPQSDIVDIPSIRPAPDLHERINQVEGRLYQSRTADWTEQSLPPHIDMSRQTRDGGVLNRDFDTLEYMTHPQTAANILARQILEANTARAEVRVPFGTDAAPMRYLDVAPGDVVLCAAPGMAGRWRVDATGPGGDDTIVLQLSREDPSRYSATASAVGGIGTVTVARDPKAAPDGLTLVFLSQLTEGMVELPPELMYTPGTPGTPTTVASDGTVTPGTPGTPGMLTVTGRDPVPIAVESDRELVATWDALADSDSAIGFRLELYEGDNAGPPPDMGDDTRMISGLRKIVDLTLARDDLVFQHAYRPNHAYRIRLARILAGGRTSMWAQVEAIAEANKTVLPDQTDQGETTTPPTTGTGGGTTATGVPGPIRFPASSGSRDAIGFAWIAPSAGAPFSGIRVYRSGAPVVPIAADRTTYRISGLASDTTVCIEVAYVNASGEGPRTRICGTTVSP